MKKFFVALFVVQAFTVMISSRLSYAQVPEIPDPNLPDIAMVTVNYFGQPIIIYNPILCSQIGPALCGFYRAHEYGHIILGHTIRQIWPQQKELEADCWAAQNARHVEVRAAIEWFSVGGGAGPIHGTSAERLQRIIYCFERR